MFDGWYEEYAEFLKDSNMVGDYSINWDWSRNPVGLEWTKKILTARFTHLETAMAFKLRYG